MLILFALTSLLNISEASAPPPGPEKMFPPIDTTISPSQLYYQQKADMPIYSGRLFLGYAVTMKGSPFYSADWDSTSIHFDGEWYHNIPILIDQHTDMVVCRSFDGNYPFYLNKDLLDQFLHHGKRYLKLDHLASGSLPKGYVEWTEEGALNLYIKRKKIIDENLDDGEVIRTFIPSDVYIIEKKGEWYIIRKEKELMALLENSKGAIKKQLRQAGLKFRKNREAFIQFSVNYFNKEAVHEN